MGEAGDREPPILNYAAAVPRRLLWRRRLALTGTLLAGVPLAAGVAVFLLWIPTRRESLEILGYFILTALPLTVPAALLALIAAAFCRPRGEGAPAAPSAAPLRPRGRRLALWALVAALNFPVGYACLWKAEAIASSVKVVVINRTSEPLAKLVLHNGSARWPVEDVPPGRTRKRTIPRPGAAPLALRGESAAGAFITTLLGFDILRLHGGEIEVEVRPAAAAAGSAGPKAPTATITRNTVR